MDGISLKAAYDSNVACSLSWATFFSFLCSGEKFMDVVFLVGTSFKYDLGAMTLEFVVGSLFIKLSVVIFSQNNMLYEGAGYLAIR